MKSKRLLIPGLIAACAIGVLGYRLLSKNEPAPRRQEELQRRLAEQQATSDSAVLGYRPAIAGDITDPAFLPADLLRSLPGVVEVTRAGPTRPAGRIVHIRDWHLVPKDDFALDSGLTDEALEAAYAEHLLEVQIVQAEQEALLRILVKHHGLRSAFIEGVARQSASEFKAVLDGHRDIVARLTKLVAKGGSAAAEAEKLLAEYRSEHLLELGSLGLLFANGELEAVLPVEDKAVLAAEKPTGPAGNLRRDAAKRKLRNDEQVKTVVEQGRCALVVLGGSHDLSESVRALAPDWEYLRVTLKSYKDIADD